MKPEITFAIPFYTGLPYLKVAIESVVAQKNANWRLLVCDDSGAESGAEELLREYRDERIRFHRNERNLGMVGSWNRCLDLADTDLVNLLHADDALRPRYTGVMSSLAERYPDASALYCETDIMDADGMQRFSFADSIKRLFRPSIGSRGIVTLEGESAVRDLMKGYFIMTPTLCYRKSKLDGRRFPDEWMQVQDLIFITELLMDGKQIVGCPERVYAYRRHRGSATHVQSESRLRFDEEFRAFGLIAERAESLGWNEAASVSREMRIVKLHLLYRALSDLIRLHPGAAWQTLRYLRANAGPTPRPG